MTKEIEGKIPALYSQDEKGKDAAVYAKYFCTRNNWRWYATEYNPETKEFFGMVCGDFNEFGYFNLSDLEAINNQYGYQIIERDIYFSPGKMTVREVMLADGYDDVSPVAQLLDKPYKKV